MSTRWQRFRERFINFYPPFIGAGIRSRRIDEYTIQAEMKLTAFNQNILGVHNGGSLYLMCDAWFVLILMRLLGSNYIIWDKAASIQFLRPGKSKVMATFYIPPERVEEIKLAAESGKIEPVFTIDVMDEQNQVVAHVEKLLYVRKKKSQSNSGIQ